MSMIEKTDEWYEKHADKRTREYKEWKKLKEAQIEKKPKGLGDTIEKVTEILGIKKIFDNLLGEDCGCDNRRKWLNAKIKYSVVKCATQDQYEYLKSFFRRPRHRVQRDVIVKLTEISNYIFNENQDYSECSSCAGPINKMILRLNIYLNDINARIESEEDNSEEE